MPFNSTLVDTSFYYITLTLILIPYYEEVFCIPSARASLCHD